MPEPIDISPDDLKTVKAILTQFTPIREVRVFGSRVNRTAKRFSDLDLVVMGDEPLSLSVLADLQTALSESPLPFKVDVVDYAKTNENFRLIIEQESVVLLF
ncbi:nucleotidyltransferase domain-containing protein [Candidatus Magnetomonas plexicatena]|nr:nucleotidyltransferase domain-containing protein [Nitrospirales bacterium LBB_01]